MRGSAPLFAPEQRLSTNPDTATFFAVPATLSEEVPYCLGAGCDPVQPLSAFDWLVH